MADLKNRFDKISGTVAAVAPADPEDIPARSKWISSDFNVPQINAEFIDWEANRRNNLKAIAAIHPLLSSSISIYEETLSLLVPGINMDIDVMVDSGKASELLMQACSRMNSKLKNFTRMHECYLIKNIITEKGIQIIACYKDKSSQEINGMIFEDAFLPSQQVNI